MKASPNAANRPQPARDPVGETGHNEKRYSKTGRIDGQEYHVFADRGAGRAGGKDRAEDRADAGRPPETEGEAENVGSCRLTPYEYICKIWTSEPDRFILNPINQMPD